MAQQQPTKSLRQILIQELDAGKLINAITTRGTHLDQHIIGDTSDTLLLDRVVSRQVFGASAFDNARDAIDLITETMYYRMPQLVDWLKDKQRNDLFIAHADFEEHTGHGFEWDKSRNAVLEFDAEAVNCVFRKTRATQYGFELITAYPTVGTVPNYTGRDLRPILHNTSTYKRAAPIYQAQLEYSVNNPKYKSYLRVNKYTGTPFFELSIPDGAVTHSVRLLSDERDCRFFSTIGGELVPSPPVAQAKNYTKTGSLIIPFSDKPFMKALSESHPYIVTECNMIRGLIRQKEFEFDRSIETSIVVSTDEYNN